MGQWVRERVRSGVQIVCVSVTVLLVVLILVEFETVALNEMVPVLGAVPVIVILEKLLIGYVPL
jgi:hypothetical protein